MMSNKLQDYEVLSIIGTGSFGTCFKVQNKLTQKMFVWKAIDYGDLDEGKRKLLLSEINVLKLLNHPNIVKYYNHIINKATQSIYIIMECCEGGDLAALIKRCINEDCNLEEAFIWRTLYQLSKAIQRCHSFKRSLTILHRDIKPSNVFIDAEGNIKLGDFGLARILDDELFAVTVVGTPYYISPEVIKGTEYNRKSHIWSLGCLIYELCTLKTPFTGKHMEMLSKNIANGMFDHIPTIYSVDLQKIISFMLSVDHGYIEIILHHPIVASNIVESTSQYPKLIPRQQRADPNEQNLSSISRISNCIGSDTTAVLRKELFYSKTKKCTELPSCVQHPIQNIRKSVSEGLLSVETACTNRSPNDITQEIFNQALRQRLIAIRQRECNLKEKEDDIRKRERAVQLLEKKMRKDKFIKTVKAVPLLPKSLHRFNYDASTFSIEPNDSVVIGTTAKFDPCTIRPPRGFQQINRVNDTFKSPLKRNRENVPTNRHKTALQNPYTVHELENAVIRSLKNCNESKPEMLQPLGNSNGSKKSSTINKRKSIFSLMNLNINQNKKPQEIVKESKSKPEIDETVTQDIRFDGNRPQPAKWTTECKRTAFEMLALMNAATSSSNSEQTNDSIVEDLVIKDKILRHDRKRQSMIMLTRSRDNV